MSSNLGNPFPECPEIVETGSEKETKDGAFDSQTQLTTERCGVEDDDDDDDDDGSCSNFSIVFDDGK